MFDFLTPYISVKKFESYLKGHKAITSHYLQLLNQYDKDIDVPKQVEFFFYSKTRENANGLKKDLEKIGYEVYGIENSLKYEYSIIGVTPPISLESEIFEKWVTEMNELGFINYCNFDGWGTITFLD